MGIKKSQINLNQLRIEIQRMTVRQELYHVLKEELTELGYWKNRKRGKPNLNIHKAEISNENN